MFHTIHNIVTEKEKCTSPLCVDKKTNLCLQGTITLLTLPNTISVVPVLVTVTQRFSSNIKYNLKVFHRFSKTLPGRHLLLYGYCTATVFSKTHRGVFSRDVSVYHTRLIVYRFSCTVYLCQ